jgi:hypothetical protein
MHRASNRNSYVDMERIYEYAVIAIEGTSESAKKRLLLFYRSGIEIFSTFKELLKLYGSTKSFLGFLFHTTAVNCIA